ncbi:MAG: tRNA 2-thiouridine(34) synthase MnmA [Oscillospiraceae bacterium]|jgi:tRNA-specific 2-thiouridylase|nr:tRNA 2-thiouridine(34) synthase MnmA [Oscillospiraceae bacterium]
MTERVLAAMSGGVDSSVAAYLLLKSGYDVTGAMMKLFENEDVGEDIMSACCSLADKGDAESAAERLDIPFYVFNYAEQFRDGVMDAFAREYSLGRTPNPCVECNRLLKFGALLERAESLGCRYIATGHYARISRSGSGQYLLKKGVDASKDQSYALFFLSQEQLARTLFPLGDMTKSETRELARELALPNASKRDSQDICFVNAAEGGYGEFLERYTGTPAVPGDFIDADGSILGQHEGLARYTIGQRRGLGISSSARLYVRELDVRRNAVLLGDEASLYKKTLTARRINLIATDTLGRDTRVTAKIRYGMREAPAIARLTDEDELYVEFDEPQRAITRGQYVVLYDGDTVIGGGTIEAAE